MAEQKFTANSGFYDSVDNDRLYSADEMNRPYKRVITNGVFATPKGDPSTDLQVLSAENALNVIIKKGEGIFNYKWFENPSDLVVTITTNTGIVPRIDSILVQIDETQSGRIGSIVYREGTPSSNPLPPAKITTEGITEYRLANIYVAPSANWIGQDAITDLRGSNECPWVTSLIKQVDTSTLYEQYRAAYQNYYDEETEAFDAFMESLTEQLTVNTNMVKYESHYTTTSDGQTEIPINIATYNKNKDVLMVRVNKLFASEGIDYTISNDGSKITLVKDLKANQSVDFIVLQSVVVGDTATVLQELQTLQNLLDTTKITSDTGSTKYSITDTSVNVLDYFMLLSIGFHTIYTASGVQGLPKTGAYRLFGQKTGSTVGWLIAMQADGSLYCNYCNNSTWRGWRTIFEVDQPLLFQSVPGIFPNGGATVTPNKPLSQCQHGWALIFTGYDDVAKEAKDYYVQTVYIPKRSYKNAQWNGESMTFSLVYSYSESNDNNLQCTKTFYVYDNRLVSSSYSATGNNRNMVLRSIHEY